MSAVAESDPKIQISPDAFARIVSNLEFDRSTRCLKWLGTVTADNQAVIRVKIKGAWKTICVRPVIRRIAVRIWGSGLGFERRCHNPLCQNPTHDHQGRSANSAS